jgi:hypothetical protein
VAPSDSARLTVIASEGFLEPGQGTEFHLFGLRAKQAQARLTFDNQSLCLRCCSSASDKQASNTEA